MRIKLDGYFFAIFFALFFILFLECSVHWTYHMFGRVNLDEISLVLLLGVDGADSDFIWSFIRKVVLRALFWAVLLGAVCRALKQYRIVTWMSFVVVSTLLCFRLCRDNVQIGSFFHFTKSDFYEQEYVVPENADIKFDKKRNVLVIALESIENSYQDKDIFGADGLIPNIFALEKQNVSFSNYHSLEGLSHTIAAITGMVAGLPLFYTSYHGVSKMRGASGIGTIFQKNGYQTYSFFPASGAFSQKTDFLTRMGFQHVTDGVQIKNSLSYKIKQEPFGGVDDYTLFQETKPMIKNIIESKQPYFIFMETINPHCKGYFTDACRTMGFAQDTMEDIVKCDDKIISDFVKWFRFQDPDAVVILIDDHKQHTGSIMKKLNRISNRSLANVFINADIFNGVNVARSVSAMDFFPTIVEAAGGRIDGCRLGLGTSLAARCAKIPTLREKYSDEKLKQLMQQKNDLYFKLAVGEK